MFLHTSVLHRYVEQTGTQAGRESRMKGRARRRRRRRMVTVSQGIDVIKRQDVLRTMLDSNKVDDRRREAGE